MNSVSFSVGSRSSLEALGANGSAGLECHALQVPAYYPVRVRAAPSSKTDACTHALR
jgi:hypothetical protein